MRYFLELSYDGTNYAGWQRQTNAMTVQSSIEAAIKTIIQKEITLTGCGRTDSGVHASYYIAHCDLDVSQEETPHFIHKLNQVLPHDIASNQLIPLTETAHARFDAYSRTYKYHIHFLKNPFLNKYSTYIPYGDKIDLDLLHESALLILSTSGFKSFCKLHGANTSHLCSVTESIWEFREDTKTLTYTISANRFLRGMVRLIVGSSLNVALGKLSISDLSAHIERGTRMHYMKSAPAQGLFLSDVRFPYIIR